MRKLLALLLYLWVAPALAQFNTQGFGFSKSGGSYVGSCTQSTTFIARTSGLTITQEGNYDALICGMVTDGTFSLLDAVWVLATNTTSTANLNLISTSYSLTQHGTVTFAAALGYTGDASSGYFDTNLNLTSATNFTQNSASYGVCITNSRTTVQSWVEAGAQGSVHNYLGPLISGALIEHNLNGSAFPTTANTNAQGSWILSRTTSAGYTLYRNGSSFVTPTDASGFPPGLDMYLLAVNSSGTAGSFSGDTLAYAFIGGALTGAQVSSLQTRLETFITAMGAAAVC